MNKVLVVDDNPDMAKLMARAVADHGYGVCLAGNGPQALEMATDERPDVILLDVMMPGMSGIEVLNRLKMDPELQWIPVILVTAKSQLNDVIEGLDAGAHDYVTKPYKREILAARVRSAVRVKQSHDQLTHLNTQLRAEIIERERMQHELAGAQKLEAIGHLAAGIAHEINTPAQYVGDNTRFLRDAFGDLDALLVQYDRLLQAARQNTVTDKLVAEVEAKLDDVDIDYLREETPNAIEQSLEGIERVTEIVRAMKDFSHPGTGEKQAVDLNRAIHSTLTVSRNEWKYVAEVVTDLDPALRPVPCLAGDINQVILNLVVNAAHAIGEAIRDRADRKGTITVRTRQEGNWAVIRIEDTGTGIPENIRENVFDHFFTTKDVGQGTGQGLSIAHSIVVQKHGGTIGFETEEGEGTTFIVRLPLASQTETENEAPAESVEIPC